MNARSAVRHRIAKIAAAVVVGAVLVVVVATAASAHAQLLSTSPAAGSVLAVAPRQVELTFGENVEISFGSIALFDQSGNRIDVGAPHHASTSDHSIESSLPHLKNGAYVLTWRVISADSHPVHGAFTFTVGSSAADVQGLAAKLEAKGGGNETVGVIFGIARAALFAGIALLLGAAVFAGAIRPHGRRRSRADALVWIGWAVAFVSTIAAVLLQGPYAGGLPLSEVFHPAVVRAVLHTRYGHLAQIRLSLLLSALPLLVTVRRHWRPRLWWWLLAAPLGLAIAATPGLAGHAATGTFTQLAVPADTLHVTAMSLWLGGLAALALVVIDRDPDATRAAEHFSPVALGSVFVIVFTGVFAAWRQAGLTVAAYTDTTYGRILLVKVATFVALIGLAGLSRRIVHKRRPATLSAMAVDAPTLLEVPRSTDPSLRPLRWTIGGELIFGIAVLSITALLVNSQPARSALSLPYSKTFHEPTMQVNLIVAPAKAGPVDIHVYTLTPSGGNLYTPNVAATISLPSKGIAPITVPLVRAGPDHFLACQRDVSQTAGTAVCSDKFSIPFPGKWLVVIRAQRNEFDEVAVQTSVNIR